MECITNRPSLRRVIDFQASVEKLKPTKKLFKIVTFVHASFSTGAVRSAFAPRYRYLGHQWRDNSNCILRKELSRARERAIISVFISCKQWVIEITHLFSPTCTRFLALNNMITLCLGMALD